MLHPTAIYPFLIVGLFRLLSTWPSQTLTGRFAVCLRIFAVFMLACYLPAPSIRCHSLPSSSPYSMPSSIFRPHTTPRLLGRARHVFSIRNPYCTASDSACTLCRDDS